VSKEWAKLSSEQKLRYRGAMLQLVQQGTRDILSEAPFVKQKVSYPYSYHSNLVVKNTMQYVSQSLKLKYSYVQYS
jgi:hypothetical protein